MELNKTLLIGNLTADPESKTIASGKELTKFRIASNRNRGERKEVLYMNVEVWGRQASACNQYLRKGSQVLVEGILKMDTYQTQAGENRTSYAIVADNVQFGARPETGQEQGSYQQQPYSQPYQQAPQGREQMPSDPPSDAEDDLPF